MSGHVTDFNARNKILTSKLQGHRYHKLRQSFSNIYRRHYEFVSKLYGDLAYKLRKIVSRDDISRKIIMRYKRIGYNVNVMRQSACLVINPITVDSFASLSNCTPVGRASDDGPNIKLIDLF